MLAKQYLMKKVLCMKVNEYKSRVQNNNRWLDCVKPSKQSCMW